MTLYILTAGHFVLGLPHQSKFYCFLIKKNTHTLRLLGIGMFITLNTKHFRVYRGQYTSCPHSVFL
jgi:hypothetical protein